jgi:hypothetical protein
MMLSPTERLVKHSSTAGLGEYLHVGTAVLARATPKRSHDANLMWDSPLVAVGHVGLLDKLGRRCMPRRSG